MRSKRARPSLVAALTFAASLTSSLAAWAVQPTLVGREFRVNQTRESLELGPVIAFASADSYLVVWESDLKGILGRFYAGNGTPASAELTLVGNRPLPTVPTLGEVSVRKHPAVVFLPGGEFFLFWTDERDYLVLDLFYENRQILEQRVRGQRFTAAGRPVGASFAVSPPAAGFSRRPHAVLAGDGVMVVWEEAAGWRTSQTVAGRLLTRRGQPRGAAMRLDAGQGSAVRDLALAGNAGGDVLVVWESERLGDPDVVACLVDRDGRVREAELGAATTGAERQRRPAVVGTLSGDFLVAWQSSLSGGSRHGIFGQLVDSAGVAVGSERQLARGIGEIQISPALALLPSGNVIATWMDWIGTSPIGLYAVVVDRSGLPLGAEVRVSEDRLYPQYESAVATNGRGEIVAAWESRIDRGRSIAARRLQAP